MIKELHIIVHSGVVMNSAEKSPWAEKAWEHIQEIMRTKEYLEISGDPTELHPNMPSPARDLIVLVSGGMTTCCVDKQRFTLNQLNYRVKFNYEACYNQDTDPHIRRY